MTGLSVCCLTADPGPRVAALLGLLRPIVDEIVVAADSRVDSEQLAHYASMADRLHRLEVDYSERHLGWLHRQCSGDWILRIDGDEVPSAALLDRLPDLVRDRAVVQYLLPRRWLHADADHWLDVTPWWPDYQLRLVRNDGSLRFHGTLHSSAVLHPPVRYLEEPLYHLDLLVNTLASRRAKARTYEQRRPGLQAPGGGPLNARFYLPEADDRAEVAPTPPPDRALIALVLEANGPAPALKRMPPVTSTAEADRFDARRSVPAEAGAASVAALERSLRMQAGERRALHFRFDNEGTDAWPWDPELGPPIRASYRLRNEGGTIVVADGPRTPFPCTLEPHESAVVPLDVVAPVVPGRYTIEPDVVHEGVRWLGARGSAALHVEPLPGWEDGAVTNVSPRRRLRDRGLSPFRRKPALPRIVHRVWLGDAELPDAARRYGDGWREHHPGWEHRLWRDADVDALVPSADLDRCRSPSERSNLVRYAVLARFGGVYVDTDVECLRPLDGLVGGTRAFAAWESERRVGTAILGSVPGHPLMTMAARVSRLTAGISVNNVESTGPGLLTLLVVDRHDVDLFGAPLFYPYRWDEPERRSETFGEAYTVHHWDLSWTGEE